MQKNPNKLTKSFTFVLKLIDSSLDQIRLILLFFELKMTSTSDYIKSMYLDPKQEDNQNYLIRKKKKKRKTKSDVSK